MRLKLSLFILYQLYIVRNWLNNDLKCMFKNLNFNPPSPPHALVRVSTVQFKSWIESEPMVQKMNWNYYFYSNSEIKIGTGNI